MGVAERKAREFEKRGDRIRKTAIELFAKKHPSRVTMDMLAKKLEIGRGTLYLHFSGKDDLMAAIVLQYYHGLRKSLMNIIVSCNSLQDCAKKIIKDFLNYTLKNIKLYSVVKRLEDNISKENLSENSLQQLEMERKNRLELLEKVYQEYWPGNNHHQIYNHIGAIWGMLKGAIDLWIDGHFAGEISNTEQYFATVESVLYQGIFVQTNYMNEESENES